MIEFGYGSERIGVRDFPPFIRITLQKSARDELFSRALRKVGEIKKEYTVSEEVFDVLYGKKKGKILKLLSKNPQPIKKLIEESGLGPSAVYHFLSSLRKQHIVSKKEGAYYLEEYNSGSLPLDEIVKIEGDPLLRGRYGISIKELELAYTLKDVYSGLAPGEKDYGRTYQNEYTLADAIHRWRTGRTDTPVWALNRLVELSGSDILQRREVITQYRQPPGIPVIPLYEGEYKIPLRVDNDLDKVVIQLLQKMCKNHLYTFPKKGRWLFDELHQHFGEFDESTSRIPSAITEILKFHYGMKTLDRSSAHIPPRMRSRWSGLTPLYRITEESSILLHIISLSSHSDSGFEITSLSKSFLEEISAIVSDLGLGTLNVCKKQGRPHFRVYISQGKVNTLRRCAHLFQEYPDLELWLRIPLNKIAEELVTATVGAESVEKICREELSRFVESILRSLERKKTFPRKDFLQYREEITHYFWEQKMIPSPRRVEELVESRIGEEEGLLYV